jgi:hypothetical protein
MLASFSTKPTIIFSRWSELIRERLNARLGHQGHVRLTKLWPPFASSLLAGFRSRTKPSKRHSGSHAGRHRNHNNFGASSFIYRSYRSSCSTAAIPTTPPEPDLRKAGSRDLHRTSVVHKVPQVLNKGVTIHAWAIATILLLHPQSNVHLSAVKCHRNSIKEVQVVDDPWRCDQ